MNDSDAMLLEAKAASDEKNEPRAQGILLKLLEPAHECYLILYIKNWVSFIKF